MRITSSEFKQQFIPVNGIINARDLGGYIMQDGRRLRDCMLIRAAHLADATDADLEYLSSLPVAKVIDFRKDIEKRGKTDRMIPGAVYMNKVSRPGKSQKALEKAFCRKFTQGQEYFLFQPSRV